MANEKQPSTNYNALATLSSVFFFWGFIAAGNSVFIPFCKNYFHLDQFQSQLIDFAFYLAYYLGALLLFILSSAFGKDYVARWGYRKSIVYGLLFSAFGSAAMIVSVYANLFPGMLLGLFIVALGFSLQQTSANPFMILIGDERTGGNRISFGGAINSLGTTIGPLIVALALFGTSAAISDDMIKSLSLTKVIILYACVGMLFVGVSALFALSKNLPDGKLVEQTASEPLEKSPKAMLTLLVMTLFLAICFIPVFSSYKSDSAIKISKLEQECDSIAKMDTLFDAKKKNSPEIILNHNQYKHDIAEIKSDVHLLKEPLEMNRLMWLSTGLLVILSGIFFAFFRGSKQQTGWGAMRYPQLSLGMLAIFVYVGVEVAVGSNLGELLKQKSFGSHSSSQIAPYIAMFWGSLMIGRWSGAINAFDLSDKLKIRLKIIVPIAAFGLVLGLTWISGYSIEALYWYVACVVVQLIAFIVTNDKPALTLSVFGILGVLAILIGINTSGTIAIYAFLSCGLFCSIMWPSIFSLSLAGLGKYQAQGSAFLVMMILGGAIIPPIQGKLSDVLGIQFSFIIGGVCFLYLTLFALIVRSLLKKQGVSLDDSGSHAH